MSTITTVELRAKKVQKKEHDKNELHECCANCCKGYR